MNSRLRARGDPSVRVPVLVMGVPGGELRTVRLGIRRGITHPIVMGRRRRNVSTGLPWYGCTVRLARLFEDGLPWYGLFQCQTSSSRQ